MEYGEDLEDLGVIETIADRVSLDTDELLRSLENHSYSHTVMGQYKQALEYGIKGIPTFLVGNLMCTGANPYEIFQSALSNCLAGPDDMAVA